MTDVNAVPGRGGIMVVTRSLAKDISLRVGPFVNLPPLLESMGHDPAALFRASGMSRQQFQDTEYRIPFLQTRKLLASCVEATGQDDLGLQLGLMATASHIGLPGFLSRVAPNVEVGLNAVKDNLDLHDEGGAVSFEKGPHHCSFGYRLTHRDVQGVEVVYDLAAVMLYKIMRALCGENWRADSVSLGRRLPTDITPYQKYFNTQIYFNATHSSLTFKSDLLQAKPIHSDELLFRHLTEESAELHDTFSNEIIDALPDCLNKALLSGQYSSKQVAAALGIHERTLHRRLKASDTSFRLEIDKARFALSQQLLSSTSLPIYDIATTLGYSDSSGFIRAFQRWCDCSPSRWRKENRVRSDSKSASASS